MADFLLKDFDILNGGDGTPSVVDPGGAWRLTAAPEDYNGYIRFDTPPNGDQAVAVGQLLPGDDDPKILFTTGRGKFVLTYELSGECDQTDDYTM